MNYISENVIRDFKRRGEAHHIFVALNKWRDNFLANQASGIFDAPLSFSMERLKEIQIDRPIVLVAASPHLDDTVADLAEYRDRFFIVCCDVAVNCLFANGIKPDMVVSLDTAPVLALHFAAIDSAGISLVCPVTLHPNALKVWQGPIFFFKQRDRIRHKDAFLQSLARDVKCTELMNDDFIGACAYQVARYLYDGFIILMGYGFAFKDHHRYCSGVYEARGIPDKPVNVNTSKMLLLYLQMFGKITVKDRRLINATCGGLYRHNNMTIREAMERYGSAGSSDKSGRLKAGDGTIRSESGEKDSCPRIEQAGNQGEEGIKGGVPEEVQPGQGKDIGALTPGKVKQTGGRDMGPVAPLFPV